MENLTLFDSHYLNSFQRKAVGSSLMVDPMTLAMGLSGRINAEEFERLNTYGIAKLTDYYLSRFKFLNIAESLIMERLGVSSVSKREWKALNGMSNNLLTGQKLFPFPTSQMIQAIGIAQIGAVLNVTYCELEDGNSLAILFCTGGIVNIVLESDHRNNKIGVYTFDDFISADLIYINESSPFDEDQGYAGIVLKVRDGIQYKEELYVSIPSYSLAYFSLMYGMAILERPLNRREETFTKAPPIYPF